jgi:hypothetical protein
MEIQTLDSSFQADQLVENYETAIWTERYAVAGDFQLTFNNIPAGLAQLPEGSFVTLRESTVPMRVETHKIEKKKNAVPVLTVTGRSCEACWLELRQSVKDLPAATGRPAWTMGANKESDAAYKAMRVVLGDAARSKDGVELLPIISPAVDPLDAIPQANLVLPVDFETGTTNTYEIKAQNLYTTVLELIAANNHGIKAVRHRDGSPWIDIEIYNGANLTDEIVFDARFDQIDDATYLLSKQGSTNVAYVYGSGGSQKVLKTQAPEPSGLDRRVLLVDDGGATAETRTNRGLVELYKYNATALFDGQVAEQVAIDYNKKYFLGDILKLTGQYGLSQDVRVTEFIRSSDNSGTKAYPTFEAVTL